MLLTTGMIVHIQVRVITLINDMYTVIILDLLGSEKTIYPQIV